MLGSIGLLGMEIAVKVSGPFTKFSFTMFSFVMALNRGDMGSIIFLLMAHNLSHSCMVALRLGPYSNINSVSVSILSPLLKIPLTVGNRGSVHPSTIPLSTNH